MRIGVPKEIKEHEYRVGLTPESVREFALALAAGGLGAIADNPGLRGGLNVHRGHVTHPAIAASLGFALKRPNRPSRPDARGKPARVSEAILPIY